MEGDGEATRGYDRTVPLLCAAKLCQDVDDVEEGLLVFSLRSKGVDGGEPVVLDDVALEAVTVMGEVGQSGGSFRDDIRFLRAFTATVNESKQGVDASVAGSLNRGGL